MEDFVSNLIKTSDLSVLTTKAVRKAYEAHIKQSLSKDEKDKLKQFVSGLLDEIAETLKVPFPTVPAEVQTSTKTPESNPQHQKAGDNVEKTAPIETLQSNAPAQKPDNSDKTVPKSVSNGVQDKLTSAKADASKEDLNSPQKLKSLKRNGSNNKSCTEPNDQKDEETEQPKKIVKKHNGKLKSKLDNEKNESPVSVDNETPTRTTSRRKNKKVNYVESDNESDNESVEMVSPTKRKLSIDPKTKSTDATDSESDLPSINEKQDSSEESFAEEKIISKPVKSPKKKVQKKISPKKKAPVKRKKKMSLEDAVDNVLESEKDMVSSPLSSIDIASTVSSDTELIDQTRKRKHVSSDEDLELVIDEDLSPLQTKKTKRKTASVKPAAKRKKLVTNSEEMDSDDQDEPLNNSNGNLVPGKKSKVSALEDLSDDEPLSKSKKPGKLSIKKKTKNLEEINSEENNKPLKSVKIAKTARKTTKRKAAAKKFKIPDEGLESDSDNEPVRPKWKPTAKASPIPKKKTAIAEISDSDNLSDIEPDEEPVKPVKKRIWAAPAKKSVSNDSDIDETLKPKPKPYAKASPISKAKMEEDAEDGSVEEESPLNSKRNKAKKQIVESDSDGGFSESEEEPLKPAKGKKKKSPKRKPKKAKAKVLEKSLNNSDNEPPKPEPEKKPLILKIKKSDIKTVSESDEESNVHPNNSLKVGAKKNGFDSGSEGSDEDSLHIDLGVSNLSKKFSPPSKAKRNARKLAHYADITDSESDLASMSSRLSSRAGSLSTRTETDLASEDSGVNVNINSKRFASKKKFMRNSKKGSENKENRKGKRSVFSLSDTESDKNAKKRELFRAFKQRNISKLLCGESFDVKQCVIRLEKIDDQIDWTTRTSKVKVSTNRKSSAPDLDLSDSDDMSLKDIKMLGTKSKQEFKSSTPVILRKVSKNWKVIVPPEFKSDSDFSDVPLKTVTNKGLNRSQLNFSSDFNVTPLKTSKSQKKKKRLKNEFLNSTFESDDTPLKSFQCAGSPFNISKKKKKSKRRTLDSTFDSSDLPLNVKPLNRENTSLQTDVTNSLDVGKDTDSSIPSPLPKKRKSKGSSKPNGNVKISTKAEDSSDSDNESLASLRRTKKLLDDEFEIISSHVSSESSKAETPRKWNRSCHNTPSKSTRSHDNTPVKSDDPRDVISESEDGSDVGSLNDSIRSLEMLKPRKREFPLKTNRGQDSHTGRARRSVSASPKKSFSLPDEIESDSDASSIIEPMDDISETSIVNKFKRSDSELGVVKGTESQKQHSPSKPNRSKNSHTRRARRSASASPKKSASRPNEIGSDSDASSIIEQMDGNQEASVASEVKRSDSELGSIKGRQSGQEASEPEDQANSEVSENGQAKKTASGLESDDSGTSMDIDSPGPMKKKGKKKTTLTKDQNKLADLRKICRCVGIILRNKIELLGCDTDQQKISRIKEILKNRGMKGEPSMDKVKLLNLKKEAAELNTDNIISDSGRSKRKVKSRFGRGDNSPSPSPKKTVTPLKLKLSGLRGVIDSEGSESD